MSNLVLRSCGLSTVFFYSFNEHLYFTKIGILQYIHDKARTKLT